MWCLLFAIKSAKLNPFYNNKNIPFSLKETTNHIPQSRVAFISTVKENIDVCQELLFSPPLLPYCSLMLLVILVENGSLELLVLN